MTDLLIREVEGGVVFGVKVLAGGGRTEICGVHDDKLKIRVSAVPEKGRANQCLIGFLARQLGVKKRAVGIVRGRSNPTKYVQVSGLSAQMLLKRLCGAEQGL